MYAYSIHYRRAPIEIRSRFAFSSDIRTKLSAALTAEGVSGHVILCTCNRTELYLSGDVNHDISTLLAAYSGMAQDEISSYLRTYYADSAYRHLFRTACGADSMILGEDEILRQVKSAYAESIERQTADFEIHTAFQAAIACAKRIKTDTALSNTPVSAATIAANEAAKCGESVRVLMIGAGGQIGSSTLKNLLAHKNVSVTVTVRSGSAAIVPEGVQTLPYAERYAYMDDADCIISATASPHFTVTAKQFADALHTQKPRLLIDLAVPRDIEPAAGLLPDARLINIDEFAQLARENRTLRESMAVQADSIIAEEIDALKKKLLFHNLLPELSQITQRMAEIPPEQLIYQLKDALDSRAFAAVAKALRTIGEGG